jgi:tRNA U34 5-methylaminomethyl-2-thiouridine-forming methyltransferase MnmC
MELPNRRPERLNSEHMPRDGDFELLTLRNGTRAVRHVGHGEVMHPSVGPWQEAQALYAAQSRLAERLQTEGPALHVWDVGLGAGTNAVAALTCARELGERQRRPLKVVSFEIDLAPLRLALADTEGFPFLRPFAAAGDALLTSGRWSEGPLDWELHLGDAAALWRERDAREHADIIFFDPFSPASNPELWTPAAFALLRRHAREDGDGCSLFTYSAATPTRVSLLLGGFFVGTGTATGMKKETTVAATRRELLAEPLDERWLARWERSTAQAPHGLALSEEIRSAVRGHAQFRQFARPSPATGASTHGSGRP